jgi:hypothetical protein
MAIYNFENLGFRFWRKEEMASVISYNQRVTFAIHTLVCILKEFHVRVYSNPKISPEGKQKKECIQ